KFLRITAKAASPTEREGSMAVPSDRNSPSWWSTRPLAAADALTSELTGPERVYRSGHGLAPPIDRGWQAALAGSGCRWRRLEARRWGRHRGGSDPSARLRRLDPPQGQAPTRRGRSEEHTSELQSRFDLVCRLLLEKK